MTTYNQLFSYLLPENKEYNEIFRVIVGELNSAHFKPVFVLYFNSVFILLFNTLHPLSNFPCIFSDIYIPILLHTNYIVWYFKS